MPVSLLDPLLQASPVTVGGEFPVLHVPFPFVCNSRL